MKTVAPLRHGDYCQWEPLCEDPRLQEQMDRTLMRVVLGGWGGPL